jgi:RNA 2',3'-cyclic 3'-phosphodiesterase
VTKGERPRGNLEAGERLRLFLALVPPGDAVAALDAWSREHLSERSGVRRLEAFHVTLAFLGSQPRSQLEPIVGALHEAARNTRPFILEPVRYRETRSVGMLVLADPEGEATRLAARLHERLEALGVYEGEKRRWLPHVTVVRFREPPRLDPPLHDLAAFAPSEAAAFLSRLHPSGARYEILDTCTLGG